MASSISLLGCSRCGYYVELPPVERACLDELGNVHVACERCGVENVAPMLPPVEGNRKRRRSGSALVGVAVWLVVLGLVLLMLPAVVYQPPPPPPDPPSFLFA